MPGSRDPQRRPVFFDLRNNRLFADPVIGNRYTLIPVASSVLDTVPANTVVGSLGVSGPAQYLTADQLVGLINAGSNTSINATRVTAGTTGSVGVVQLNNSVSSTSTTTAATANAVKQAYDLADVASSTASAASATASAASSTASSASSVANAALPRTGGVMTGLISFATGQSIAGYLRTADLGVTVQGFDANTAKTNAAQTFTAAQRGAITALTPGASVSPDFAVGNNFSLTLGQNTVLANPTNVTPGQSGIIVITQNSSSSYTVSYGSYWRFAGGVPEMSGVPGSVSTLAYYVESATRITASLLVNVV